MRKSLQRLIVRFRRYLGPVRVLQHRFWRATGVSGLEFDWPELQKLSKIATDLTAAPATGPRILMFTFREWHPHVMWDVLLGHALRQRGADVQFFTCGGRLPICDIWAHTLAPPMPCNRCAPYITRALSILQLPHKEMRDYVPADERGEIERMISALAPADYERFEFDNLPLGELVRPSLQWFLLSGSPVFDREMQEGYRRFLISGAILSRVASRMLDDMKPELVYLLNGIFFAERIAIEHARRRGIPFITHEGGLLPDSQVFARNGFAPYYDLDAVWPMYATRPLTDTEDLRLDAYLEERSAGRSNLAALYPTIESNREAVAQRIGLDRTKPIVTLFTNVDWDTACFAGGRAFGNMAEWIEQTIRTFSARSDCQLVVRIHPGEVRLLHLQPREPVAALIRRVFVELPPNVHLIPPESDISSYALMDLSRLGLVYTSTAGMEMVLRGKPVITAGRGYYVGKGFTIDAQSRAEYDQLLARAESFGPVSQEQLDLGRRYASLFFFRHHHRFPFVNYDDGRVHLKLETLADLRPGQQPVLDLVCDAILRERPFLYEGSL